MKTTLVTLLLTLALSNAHAQYKMKSDTGNKINSGKFATDSAKRGNEIYKGGKNEKREAQPKRRERTPATKATPTTGTN